MKISLKSTCIVGVLGLLTCLTENVRAQIILPPITLTGLNDPWNASPIKLDGEPLIGSLAYVAISYVPQLDLWTESLTVKWPVNADPAPFYVEIGPGSGNEVFYRGALNPTSGQANMVPGIPGFLAALNDGKASVWLVGDPNPSDPSAPALPTGILVDPIVFHAPEPLPTASLGFLGACGVWMAIKRRRDRKAKSA